MKILSIEDAKRLARPGPNGPVIITGVTGQDGSFMADYLLENTPYQIFGGARRLSVENHANIRHLEKNERFHLINFDLTDAHSISQIISQLKPSYFINFAAQSFVKSSWDFPAQTWETNTTSIIHILEAIRLHDPDCRFYNAGSSEEFGDVLNPTQDETTPLRPRSPYGASKAAGRQLVKVYRESYGLYAIQGWLFNHEGTRRGEEFVTRKITKAVANIAKLVRNNLPFDPLELGNLDARRDWSDAEDCVDAVWRMLNQDDYSELLMCKEGESWSTQGLSEQVREYVVASGETHTIREFVEKAFEHVNIKGHWEGTGMEEKYIWDVLSWPDIVLVKVNPAFYRPAEVELLHGDSTRIREELSWEPKTSFDQLVKKMVDNDLK